MIRKSTPIRSTYLQVKNEHEKSLGICLFPRFFYVLRLKKKCNKLEENCFKPLEIAITFNIVGIRAATALLYIHYVYLQVREQVGCLLPFFLQIPHAFAR